MLEEVCIMNGMKDMYLIIVTKPNFIVGEKPNCHETFSIFEK